LDSHQPASGSNQVASQWDSAVRQFAKRGLALCLILFLVELALLVLVSSAPFFPGEQSLYTGQAKSLGGLVQNSTTPQLALEIFSNNYKIALEEMIPGFGALLFAISLYATARVTKAIAIDDKVPALSLVLLLFILPHSWIELPAYAVATAEGLYLLAAIVRTARFVGPTRDWGRLRIEAWQLALNLIIVTVMLAVAAVFESVEIALGDYALITWIPFAGLVAVVVSLNKRLSGIRKGANTAATLPSTQV